MISVIVPIYKVEKYLKQCIDSIIAQSYTNLEIILVDDGSPDSCPEMVDAYARIDERIKVIHKKNGGLSDARNAGLSIATGEYISFVDSDDFIHKDMFLLMMNAIAQLNADIVVANHYLFYDNTQVLDEEVNKCDKESLDGVSAIGKLYTNEQPVYVTAWGKIYKRTVFENLLFPVGKLHEDVFTTYKAYARANKVVYLDNKLYYYRQREGSIMQTNFSLRNLDALMGLREMMNYVLTIEGFAKKYNVVGEFIEKLVYYYYKLITIRTAEKDSVRANLLKEARALVKKYSKYLSFKDKLKFSCFVHSPRMYRLLRGGVKERIKKDFEKCKRQLFIIKYSMIPIQNNKVVLWANDFTFYGCNPKHIAEYILDSYPTQFDLVWVFDSKLPIPKDISPKIRVVRYFSKEYLYELHTAHFVICNSRTGKNTFWRKRVGQIYIQTWHSPLRLKNIEKDAEAFLSKKYIQAAKEDSKKIDYMVSGCTFSTNIYKKSFWYNGPILEYGTPRIDYLLNSMNKSKAKKKIGLDDHVQYILYAPTFRSNYNFDYKINFLKLILCCEKRFGGKWKVLYRLHPNLVFEDKDSLLGESCIDMCKYSDMQELIMASDILISDYSSCIFDALYARIKCFLYIPDYERYSTEERNLYFDINDIPACKALNELELCKNIEFFDNEAYDANTEEFLLKIGSFETGSACKSIVSLMVAGGM